MKSVYLAVPIDYSGQPDFAKELAEAIARRGFAVYVPSMAWNLDLSLCNGEVAHAIQNINDYALINSDIVVAVLGHVSCGVPREIIIADDLAKPIVAIRENFHHRTIFEHNVQNMVIAMNVEQAIDDLADIRKGMG